MLLYYVSEAALKDLSVHVFSMTPGPPGPAGTPGLPGQDVSVFICRYIKTNGFLSSRRLKSQSSSLLLLQGQGRTPRQAGGRWTQRRRRGKGEGSDRKSVVKLTLWFATVVHTSIKAKQLFFTSMTNPSSRLSLTNLGPLICPSLRGPLSLNLIPFPLRK